jgi:hypothetical protein
MIVFPPRIATLFVQACYALLSGKITTRKPLTRIENSYHAKPEQKKDSDGYQPAGIHLQLARSARIMLTNGGKAIAATWRSNHLR